MNEQQHSVNWHFTENARYWTGIYQRSDDLYAEIYRERLRVVLELADRIGLRNGSRVLEIGCGGGYASVALAKRGFDVTAIDAVQTMVDSTRKRAISENVEDRVRASLGDVRSLLFPENTFNLVVGVGLLPWLPSMKEPTREMSRVLRPDGSLIVTVENRWGLRQFLDPIANPLLLPVKESVKTLLRLSHLYIPKVHPRRTSIAHCDAVLHANGFDKVAGVTLGFGPFMIFGYPLLPYSFGLKAHRALQHLAYRSVPLICSSGAEYVVLAKKRGAGA